MEAESIEDYYCNYCNHFWEFSDVKTKWRCPECDEFVFIKQVVNNYEYAVSRVTVADIKKSDGIILPGNTIHHVLNIEKNGQNYRIALKEYGVLKCDNQKEFNKIVGGWHLTK